jgi:predicted DNA binding CopG/RHH family protein
MQAKQSKASPKSGRNVIKKDATKNKINFNDYELVDELDEEEQLIWNELQQGNYKSIMTPKLKNKYAEIFSNSNKRDQSSNLRLTMNDKLLAKAKAREEGVPYQVLLSSIIHKWLHGKLKEA